MPVLDYFLNVINNPRIRKPLRKIFDEILDDLDTNKTSANANIVVYEAHTHMFGHADMGLSKAGLDLDGDGSAADLETNAAFEYAINGVCYSLAAQGQIDLSSLAGYTPVAIATATQAILLVSVNAAGTIHVTQGTAHASAAVCPDTPAGDVPLGYVKIVNASGSDFTPGTTELSAAGITDTYVDLVFSPVGANGQGITSAPGTNTGDVDQGTPSTMTDMIQTVTHP